MNLVCSGMKNLLILFSFFVIFEINAQVYLYPDSLRQALGKLEEKDQVLDLLRIGFYYAQENTDSAYTMSIKQKILPSSIKTL